MWITVRNLNSKRFLVNIDKIEAIEAIEHPLWENNQKISYPGCIIHLINKQISTLTSFEEIQKQIDLFQDKIVYLPLEKPE